MKLPNLFALEGQMKFREAGGMIYGGHDSAVIVVMDVGMPDGVTEFKSALINVFNAEVRVVFSLEQARACLLAHRERLGNSFFDHLMQSAARLAWRRSGSVPPATRITGEAANVLARLLLAEGLKDPETLNALLVGQGEFIIDRRSRSGDDTVH